MKDLENILLREAEGITLWDTTICSMLYADDLILLAKSANDLQQQINTLADYAKTWNLEINTDKTKVLIFNKSTKTSNNVWKIDDTVIEEVTT